MSELRFVYLNGTLVGFTSIADGFRPLKIPKGAPLVPANENKEDEEETEDEESAAKQRNLSSSKRRD